MANTVMKVLLIVMKLHGYNISADDYSFRAIYPKLH